jgi:HAMP domain-containing protein
MLKDLKIRRVAYFMGFVLFSLACLQVLLVHRASLSDADVFVARKAVELRELSGQVNHTLSLLVKQQNIPEKQLEKELESFANVRARYQAVLSLLRSGGTLREADKDYQVPPPPQELAVKLEKLNEEWEQYQNDIGEVIETVIRTYNLNSTKDIAWLPNKYKLFLVKNEQIAEAYQSLLIQKQERLLGWQWLFFGVYLLVIAVIFFIVRNLVMIPIGLIARSSRELAKGNLSQKIRFQSRNEIGYIAQNVNDLAEILKNATEFSKAIGQGNLEVEYKGISKEQMADNASIMGALLSMRARLREVAVKDLQERWLNTGLAQFSDILRKSSNDDLPTLTYDIIAGIVNYLDAHQGALYVLNDEHLNQEQHYLEASACYAMHKKKQLEKRIESGEGLIGQVMIDKETLYINDVPDNYDRISSALGGTKPRSVLIVPLIANDELQGVLEILSLYEIPQYQIAFVERVSESAASTIRLVKANYKNKLIIKLNEELDKRMQSRR